ncbi:MAG: hypothetical protein ACI4SL_11430 [Candidatus Ornithospirochaeta sp.]
MKKFLLLFLILMMILPLFGKITISESVPSEYYDTVNSALLDITEGRRDADIIFDSFSLENDLVSFSISVDGERSDTTVPLTFMEKEIRNMLFYSQPLFSESENRLDYVSILSYSTVSSPDLRKGSVVFVKDEKDSTRGVFVASSKHNEAFELDALYLSSVLPGMKLEKGRGIEFDTSYSISLTTLAMSLETGVSFYTPIYPLLPYFSVGVDLNSLQNGFFLGVGGRTMFCLSSLWGDIPIVRNITVDGKVELLLRFGDEINLGGRWNMSGVWRPLSWLNLSLGYTYDSYLGNMISLSLGALI